MDLALAAHAPAPQQEFEATQPVDEQHVSFAANEDRVSHPDYKKRLCLCCDSVESALVVCGKCTAFWRHPEMAGVRAGIIAAGKRWKFGKDTDAYNNEMHNIFKPALMEFRSSLNAYAVTRSLDAVTATLNQSAALRAAATQSLANFMQGGTARPAQRAPNAALVSAGFGVPPRMLQPSLAASDGPRMPMAPPPLFLGAAPPTLPAVSVASTPPPAPPSAVVPAPSLDTLKEEIAAELSAHLEEEMAGLKHEQNAYLNEEFMEQVKALVAEQYERLSSGMLAKVEEVVAQQVEKAMAKKKKKATTAAGDDGAPPEEKRQKKSGGGHQ